MPVASSPGLALARGQHVDALENFGRGLVRDPAGDEQPHERHQHARERLSTRFDEPSSGGLGHGLIFIRGG